MTTDEIVMDTEEQNVEDAKDGKRTKWQPPPSHLTLLYSPPTRKSKIPTHRSFSREGNVGVAATIQHLDDEGIDDTDMNVIDGNACQRFAKPTIGHSYQEIQDVLSSPKSYKGSSVARADICPKIGRPRLQHSKGLGAKIREQYGYEIKSTSYLYAEEALYLIEIGKLELCLNQVHASVERARSLLLHSKSCPEILPTKIKTCSIDEYLVYKYLSKQGYRLRRRDHCADIKLECYGIPATPDSTSPSPMDTEKAMEVEPNVEENISNMKEAAMDLEDATALPNVEELANDSGIGINQARKDCTNNRGVKRKFTEVSGNQTTGSTTPTSSAKDMSDNDDADAEFDFVSASGDACMDSTSESHILQQPEGYMVTEADSDVEFVDEGEECTPKGVLIEEICYDYDGDIEEDFGCKQEPQPSTSSACLPPQGVVHLVESDSDGEEEVKSFSKIWNKFVPNATIQIGFPPQALLPENIPYRPTIYEFDMTNKETRQSDSELEYFVDELNLNSSPGDSDVEQNLAKNHNKHNCKSWKDWKQKTIDEAREVLLDSLLANSLKHGSCEDAMKKLYLWEHQKPITKPNATAGWESFNIPFDLYHPSVGSNVHKTKLKSDFQPCYAVAIVRNNDELTSFSGCEPTLQGVPILIALVSDEADIIFMNPDRSPVPSLFNITP